MQDKALLVLRCQELEAAAASREEDLARVKSELSRHASESRSRTEVMESPQQV